jgi:hypothetical protein
MPIVITSTHDTVVIDPVTMEAVLQRRADWELRWDPATSPVFQAELTCIKDDKPTPMCSAGVCSAYQYISLLSLPKVLFSLYLSVCLSVCKSVHPSLSLSVCLAGCLSVCITVCLNNRLY